MFGRCLFLILALRALIGDTDPLNYYLEIGLTDTSLSRKELIS